MGCIGYKNYQHFLQFAFWASLYMGVMTAFLASNYNDLLLSTDNLIFLYSGAVASIFGWVVFFLYGTMALKGVTIIEASEIFKNRRQEVA